MSWHADISRPYILAETCSLKRVIKEIKFIARHPSNKEGAFRKPL
jgi:hypothetical protein